MIVHESSQAIWIPLFAVFVERFRCEEAKRITLESKYEIGEKCGVERETRLELATSSLEG